MTERELIEELATLGKIYLDCHEAKWSATTTPCPRRRRWSGW